MKHLTMQAAYKRVGRMEQLAGMKRYVLQEGRQRGVHAVDLVDQSQPPAMPGAKK